MWEGLGPLLGPVLGAVAGFLTVVVPLWIRLKQEIGKARADVEKLAREKAKQVAVISSKERKDAIDEYRQALEDIRLDRMSDRELVHGLRGDNQKLLNDKAVLRVQLENMTEDRDRWRRRALGHPRPGDTEEQSQDADGGTEAQGD